MDNYYNEFFESMENASDAEVLRTVFVVFVVAFAVFFLWAVACYIMRSLSLFQIAKRRQITNYGLAWVPVIYVWTLGAIADQYDQNRGITRRWRIALLTLAVISVIAATGFWLYYVIGFIIPVIEEASAMSGGLDDPASILKYLLPMYGFLIPLYMAAGAESICKCICVYKLYESCKPKKALKLLLLALLVPFAAPFCLLSCKKWDNSVIAQPLRQIEGMPYKTEN